MTDTTYKPDRPLLDFAAASRLLAAVDSRDDAACHEPDKYTPTLPRIHGYVVESLLGVGAGGTVFKARREGSDRWLALKMLEARPGEPRAQRAWRELAALEALRLECVPRVVDYGTHEGRLYIAAELVEGLPLDRYVESTIGRAGGVGGAVRRGGEDRACVELLARVADAVQQVHEHGVIHRDLKPSNILVGEGGRPFILDLGLAHLTTDQPTGTLTEEGTPLGTPAFMSPEQARGERARVSTRSDVYSLGATAYLLLTGHTPHAGDASIHETIRRAAQEPAREPRTLRSSLPKPLAAVLLKACDFDPSRRYASAAEFAADLRRWAKGEAVEAVEPGVWRRAAKWVFKHPAVTAAILSMLLTSCVFLAGNFYVRYLASTAPDHFDFSADRRTARLVNLGERVIRAWTSENDPILLARIVTRPDALGGGRVVIVGHPQSQSVEDPFEGQVCVYDVNDLTAPLWHTPTGPPGLTPPRDPQAGDHTYHALSAIVADIFPDLPGEEIATIHNQSTSPSAVRVYNLRGDVLFEAWHRGSMGGANVPYWIPDARILVILASDNEIELDKYGYSDDATEPAFLSKENYAADVYPTVLIGLALKNGERGLWLNTSRRTSPPTPDGILRWYRYIAPPKRRAVLPNIRLSTPVSADVMRTCVQANLYSADGAAGIWLIVDRHGHVLPEKTDASDTYKHRYPHYPLDTWQLWDAIPRRDPAKPRSGS